jgi:hypothetical protein
MMRAAPPSWVTAASWSGARSASVLVAEWQPQRAMLDRHPVQHADPVDGCGVARRATVEPGPNAVGQLDVAAAIVHGAGAGTHRLLQQRPGRLRAQIDRVAEHEVVQLLGGELHPRPHRVRRQRGGERGGQLLLDRRRQLQHATRALRGVFEQHLDELAGRGVDGEPWCARPPRRRWLAGGDDDIPAERRRPRVGLHLGDICHGRGSAEGVGRPRWNGT